MGPVGLLSWLQHAGSAGQRGVLQGSSCLCQRDLSALVLAELAFHVGSALLGIGAAGSAVRPANQLRSQLRAGERSLPQRLAPVPKTNSASKTPGEPLPEAAHSHGV